MKIGNAIAKKVSTALGHSRVYPQILPQNPTLPAIVYHVLNHKAADTIEGAAGLFESDVQLDIYAKTALEAQNAAETCRLTLQGFKGVVTIASGNTLEIGGIYFDHAATDFEGLVNEYKQILRFSCWFTLPNSTNNS